MAGLIAYLREFNFAAVAFRLLLSLAFGGIIGLEREWKHRPAGFRTYMLVCMGAALTMLLGQYESAMLTGGWADPAGKIGASVDVARFGAQVVSGIGFLGAGTIIVTGTREVKGLTTAAGLWASACMGLAIGTGFYECVFPAFLLMLLSIWLLPYVESSIMEHARSVNLYVEFQSLDDAGAVIARLKTRDVQIYDVELTRGQEESGLHPSAVFYLYLRTPMPHEQLLSELSELEHVIAINEI